MNTILVSKKEQKNKNAKVQIINLGKATELTWGAAFKRNESNNRRPLSNIERQGS
jgi:hypothetical protein